jgi:DNA-binding response OmpR family regulator
MFRKNLHVSFHCLCEVLRLTFAEIAGTMETYIGKKILTVDDDEAIRLTLSQLLEAEGFESVWAKNGQVALDYLKALPDNELPHLVLLDFMMPIMNGQDFCREKAKIERLSKIPVVMMTAGGNLVNVMDRLEQDAEGYMAKPMDIETVIKMVKHFLQTH